MQRRLVWCRGLLQGEQACHEVFGIWNAIRLCKSAEVLSTCLHPARHAPAISHAMLVPAPSWSMHLERWDDLSVAIIDA